MKRNFFPVPDFKGLELAALRFSSGFVSAVVSMGQQGLFAAGVIWQPEPALAPALAVL